MLSLSSTMAYELWFKLLLHELEKVESDFSLVRNGRMQLLALPHHFKLWLDNSTSWKQ